jgi:hypothetical protein
VAIVVEPVVLAPPQGRERARGVEVGERRQEVPLRGCEPVGREGGKAPRPAADDRTAHVAAPPLGPRPVRRVGRTSRQIGSGSAGRGAVDFFKSTRSRFLR